MACIDPFGLEKYKTNEIPEWFEKKAGTDVDVWNFFLMSTIAMGIKDIEAEFFNLVDKGNFDKIYRPWYGSRDEMISYITTNCPFKIITSGKFELRSSEEIENLVDYKLSVNKPIMQSEFTFLQAPAGAGEDPWYFKTPIINAIPYTLEGITLFGEPFTENYEKWSQMRGRFLTQEEAQLAMLSSLWTTGTLGIGAYGQSNLVFKEGEFNISNWEGYPNGPRPAGPFKILEGTEYDTARNTANVANRALHIANPALKGFQIHEIAPVKFGGNPTAFTNKIFLDVKEHVKYTTFWKNVLIKIVTEEN